MTVVKICGLKEVAHVEVACTAGADFLGFMFAPSKRQISVETAQVLAKSVPPHMKKVGVFVNERADVIRAIAKAVPLDFIQYHGDETQALIDEVGLPSIKAYSVRTQDDVEKATHYNVDYYLFDAPGTDFRGGSGHQFDWSLLEEANIPREKIMLAGGLHKENVAAAIKQVQPFAVDVSSGVETDGIKDIVKIKQFITAVKGAKSQ